MRRRAAARPAEKDTQKVPWASFADALTGLLFVFILLTMKFALDLETARQQAVEQQEAARAEELAARKAKEARERALQIMIGGAGPGADQKTSFFECVQSHPTAGLQAELDRDYRRVSLRHPALRSSEAGLGREGIEATSIVWFEPGQDVFDRRVDTERIKTVGRCLEKSEVWGHLEKYNLRLRVLVEGHTDTSLVQGSGSSSNWELSAKRAVRFVEVLLGASSSVEREAFQTELSRRTDEGWLDIAPVGLEATVPARVQLCPESAEPGAARASDSDPVCRCIRTPTAGSASGLELRRFLDCRSELQAVLFEKTGDERYRSESLSALEMAREWGNLDETRRGLNRRVSLRFEIDEISYAAMDPSAQRLGDDGE